MVGYENSKIYCLWCNDEYYYIGSTKNELRCRLRDHKSASKKQIERKVYKHINEIGWDNVKIQLIENYPCDSIEELHLKENEYICSMRGDDHCLNMKASTYTEEDLIYYKKHYRQENRDKILDYKKKYREENKEKIAEYNKKYEESHTEQVKEARAKYIEENKEKIAAKTKAYREAHKDEIKEWLVKYNEENKEKLKEKSKLGRERNKEAIKERGKKYYEENKDEINKKYKEYVTATRDVRLIQQKKYRDESKLKNPPVSEICEICQGSFQNYRKSRHESSKKHMDAMIMP